MGTTAIKPVEDSAVEEKCSPVIEKAKSLNIINDEGLEKAKAIVLGIKALIAEVEGDFNPIVTAAHKTHKEALARKNKHLTPLQGADKIIRDTMKAYLDLKDKQAEAERKRLQKLQEEADKKVLKNLEAKEKRLEKKGGDNEEALRDIEEEKGMVGNAPTFVAETSGKSNVKGVSGRKVRIPTVTNKQAIIAAVLRGDAPASIIDINMGQLKKYVNLGENMRVAGVNITTDRSMTVR